MSRRLDDLIVGLCGAADHPLAPFLRRWSQESPPFVEFAQAHAAKIRKKVRLASLPDERHDLLAELAVAALLVRDRRSAVRYEPPHPVGQRGPDFEVAFKGHTTWRAEVTRLRLPEAQAEYDPAGASRRVARLIGDKIGQCLPGAANLLAVVVPFAAARGELVLAALRLLDGPSPSGLPPESVRAFLRDRQRLSAVALCSFSGDGGEPVAFHLWLNAQAKHPLPPEVARFLVRAVP